MNPLTSRQRRQAKTRQAILDAARQIIIEKGPGELSMRSLAERIDYSPSGLYEYFDSKEDIIHAVCLEGHALLTQEMRVVDESLPPPEYLLQIGLAYIRFAIRNPEYYLLMFTSSQVEPSQEEMLSESSSYAILVRCIERGIQSGDFLPRPHFGLFEMAFAAWSLVHGIAMLRIYMKSEPPDFSQTVSMTLQNFSRGLMAR